MKSCAAPFDISLLFTLRNLMGRFIDALTIAQKYEMAYFNFKKGKLFRIISTMIVGELSKRNRTQHGCSGAVCGENVY